MALDAGGGTAVAATAFRSRRSVHFASASLIKGVSLVKTLNFCEFFQTQLFYSNSQFFF
jgi:hypothetical protein